MNILVLVFSFLAVIALSTASFWHTTTSIKQEASGFCGYLTANRKAENVLQRKLFKKLPTVDKTIFKKSPVSSSIRYSAYHNPRCKSRPHPFGHLQVGALWTAEADPFLEQVFLRLLDQLYGHTAWYSQAKEKGDLDALLANIMRIGKEKKGKFAIYEILTSLDPSQADLFYKMLKGTHTYSFEKKVGYPPLLHFVSFDSANKTKTCHFSFASLPLLQALFDPDTVHDILELEKKKWDEDHKNHTCTKEELVEFLQFRPKSFTQPSHLESYFDFTKRASPSYEISAHDTFSKIHAERHLENAKP